jgi:hypothetical protein
MGQSDLQRRTQLSQRYLLDQQYHSLQEAFYSCVGTYHVIYSFCVAELPLNAFVPD